MFKTFKLEKIKFKPSIVDASDLLPESVEDSNGEILKFDAQKIINSIIKETELDKKQAEDTTLAVLRFLVGTGLKTISAPHLRELVCQELTKRGLHKYRNKYTRLGLPLYDVTKLMNDNKSILFKYKCITMQIFEEYIQLMGDTKLSNQLLCYMEMDCLTHTSFKSKEERELLNNKLSKFKKLFYSKYRSAKK